MINFRIIIIIIIIIINIIIIIVPGYRFTGSSGADITDDITDKLFMLFIGLSNICLQLLIQGNKAHG